jgi:hypothetical protein
MFLKRYNTNSIEIENPKSLNNSVDISLVFFFQEALKMMNDIESVLKPKGYICSAFQERRVVKLPKGKFITNK